MELGTSKRLFLCRYLGLAYRVVLLHSSRDKRQVLHSKAYRSATDDQGEQQWNSTRCLMQRYEPGEWRHMSPRPKGMAKRPELSFSQPEVGEVKNNEVDY
jgi:hypothetical protein